MNDFWKAVNRCASNTTHHGLNHAGNAKSKRFKFFWLAIVAIAYMCFFYHLSSLLTRYFSYPVSTGIEYMSVPFRFPDVTICNLMPFSLRMVEKRYGSLEILNTADRDLFMRLLEEAEIPKQDFIVSCFYQGDECNPALIEKIYNADYTLCYRISAGSQTDRPNIQLNYLQVMLYVDSQHSHRLPKLSQRLSEELLAYWNWDASGVRVIVHEPGTHPHPYKNGFDIRTGLSGKVALTPERVELLNGYGKQKECEASPGTISYCDYHQQGSQTFVKTKADCIVETVQEYMVRECGCVTHNYLIPAKYCTMNTPTCAANELNTTDDCEGSVLYSVFADIDELSKNCLTPCVSDKWKFEVSFGEWPHHLVENGALDMLRQLHAEAEANNITSILDELALASDEAIEKYDLLKKNMIKMSVQSAVPFGNRIYEEPAYPLSSFLGELGGIAGLWCGCSVLTFFEPISFILSACRKLRRKRQHELSTKCKTDDV